MRGAVPTLGRDVFLPGELRRAQSLMPLENIRLMEGLGVW